MNDSANASALFQPYDAKGGWSRRDATHLLWRAGFGATEAEIDSAMASGLEATVQRLTESQAESAEFQAAESVLRNVAVDTGRADHMKAWWLYRMLHSANPLLEKTTLFWHNHFATSNAKVKSVDQMLAQNDLIRRHALGSFRDLLHGISRDPAMLVWLDGNDNRKRHANENFAREVMELFSLGVGNYTEHDITEAARAFTGWHVRNGQFWVNRLQHDDSEKTVLGTTGRLKGDDVIDICLKQSACPRFLSSKVLRTFVLPRPTPAMVDELAKRIRLHDFQMTPVLRELFQSRLFFSRDARHALIKSPIDFVLGTLRTLQVRADLLATIPLLAGLGQDVFEPPTVKGWEGGRLWVSSTTLLQRANFVTDLLHRGRYGKVDSTTVLALADGQVADTVARLTDLLLAGNIDVSAADRVRSYASRVIGSPEQRTGHLLRLIMTLPEYELM